MDFLKTLVTVSALLSLALLLLPDKKEIKRSAYTVFSLILLLFLIPKDGSFALSSLIRWETEAPPSDGDAYGETVALAISSGIVRDLTDRFSLNEAGVSVVTDATVTEAGLSGSFITVTLGRENLSADVTSILRYLKNTYSLDCEVRFLGD